MMGKCRGQPASNYAWKKNEGRKFLENDVKYSEFLSSIVINKLDIEKLIYEIC